jgi:hypothetical protein
MTNCIPTNRSQSFAPAGIRLLPIVIFLALCLAATAARAAIAVVTFTNFPAVVSNTYNGVITLQINGLTNGVTNVVVQKFLDVDTNPVIDSRDIMVQQFQLTVGQASVFTNGNTPVTVTNFMPGDMTSATGQITAPLNFQNGDFAQSLVGQYFYKISSPSGQFNPSTNLLTVTNAFFSSYITGVVQNAESTTGLSNSIVLLCVPQSGSLNVQAGTVSDLSGNFTLRAPPGIYFLAAAGSNFVADLSQSSSFLLSTNSTNYETVLLDPSTTYVTGRVVDATSSLGLPGLDGMLISSNNTFSLFFTDTNGGFRAPATTTNFWETTINPFSAAFKGYVTWQTNYSFNVSNKVVGVTNTLPRATAIFYGTVTNSLGTPGAGIYLYASDTIGHQSFAMTDQNGNYVLNTLAETNPWTLSILATNNPGLTNVFVFSPGYVQTNFQAGQAIQQNFSLKYAPYTISGTVEDLNGNPIAGVEVFATATNVNGAPYEAFYALTSGSGTYSLNVCPANWTVGITPSSLESLGYEIIPPDQSTNITDENGTINFSVVVCSQIAILTTNLSNGMIGSYYETNLLAISCDTNTSWSTAYGITLNSLSDQTNIIYPPGTPVYSTGGLVGYLQSYFSYGIQNNVWFVNNVSYTGVSAGNQTVTFTGLSTTVNISGPVASNTTVNVNGKVWLTTAAPSQQGNGSYQTTLYLASDSFTGKTSFYAATNGMFITHTSSKNTTNIVGVLVGNFYSLPTAGNTANVPSTLPYNGTNDGVVWVKNGTNNWGQYLISTYGVQNTNLPPGMVLYPDGTFAGTPSSLGTNGGLFNFSIYAEDNHSNVAVQPFSFFVYPATTITLLQSNNFVTASNLFQMQINGVIAGQNYTLLMTTNLDSGTNWVPIFTTNAPGTNSLIISDSNATNPAQFYRIMLGP